MIRRGLLCGEFSTSTGNQIFGRSKLNKLEAVAECLPLPHERQDFHIAQGQSEFEPNHFADGDFDPKHRGNASLAQINRVSAHDIFITRINLYIHFNLVAGMKALLHEFFDSCRSERIGVNLAAKFQKQGLRGDSENKYLAISHYSLRSTSDQSQMSHLLLKPQSRMRPTIQRDQAR
jgi:hypothetical protein